MTTTPPTVVLRIPETVRRIAIMVDPGTQMGVRLVTTKSVQVLVRGSAASERSLLYLGVGRIGKLQITHSSVVLEPLRASGVREIAPHITRLECRESDLRTERNPGLIAKLIASGTSSLVLGDYQIKSLAVNAGAQLQMQAKVERRFVLAESVPDGATPASLRGFTLRKNSSINCGSMQFVKAHLAEGAELRCKDVLNSAFSGPGRLIVERQSDGLHFLEPPVSLLAGQFAQLRNLSGKVTLSEGKDALFAGRRRVDGTLDAARGLLKPPDFVGLVVEDIASSEDDSLAGASLREVAFPVTRTGLRSISVLMQSASTVEPALYGGLPGRPAMPFADKSGLDPQLEAEYGRAIADLARSKGAAASTRTYLAACSYRLRQRVCGRLERLVLQAYGLLGYGERFAPAFASFVAVSLGLGLLSMARLDGPGLPAWSDVGPYLVAVRDWLISPLHVLRLSKPINEAAQFEQPWDTLARVIVAIPFAVAVLALRNYVKDDHRSRSKT